MIKLKAPSSLVGLKKYSATASHSYDFFWATAVSVAPLMRHHAQENTD
ncbi:MAG: hypothetical protein IJR49_04050 [Treponema sp.]|nr:hypothetical protein [Treponema sp.]